MTAKNFWNITFPILRNKFVLTLLIFGVWILLFDQNNLLDRFYEMKSLKALVEEKAYYSNKIQEDQRRMNELESNKDDLEKFAREQYLMKKDNEDVFVVVEKE
ncbi:MAG: septum formation initiator family protein [Salinivirgaceae bacterium]|nr:septum formation initiator family protein [Salinivirgaceae bacterium]